MSEETKSVPTQEAQDTVAKNDQSPSSDDGLLQELMKYKSQRNELRDELASYKAAEEKRRTKKLEEEGKLQEVIVELKSQKEKDDVELNALRDLKNSVKMDIVNSLTSDEKKREMLLTKDLETLKFIKEEKNSLMSTNPISNPGQTLGAVRSKPLTESIINKMTADEKRENWSDITEFFKNKS
tara:strand:- start:1930 stop:2478 length:549 start_codon:yes stop_codon:yes gene_type:complete